jgi:hypothetical protein
MKFLKLKCFFILHSAFCILFLSGCEWSSGGGAQTWNDRENFVDFSGDYKNADGGVLVRKFGAGSGSTTNTTTATNAVSGEVLATGDGSATVFSGGLAHPPIRGTLTIVVGGYRFSDPGTASAGTVSLTVTPSDGTSGTLNLNTGVWSLFFASPIASGTPIIGAYQYLSSTSVVNPNQGSHGNPIYSFVLNQQGNKIKITDSCSSTYEGTIGSVRTTGGVPIDLDPSAPTQPPVPTTGPIVAQFSATGYSQGYNVQIVGVLQGTLTAATTLSGRTMKATFIEEGGYEADVNGTAQ